MSSQTNTDDNLPKDNTHGTKTTTSDRESSGMTPSIMTTINNTSPHGPLVNPSTNSNNNNPSIVTKGNRRTNEPYESYIEDSFVGHWENEDDDPLYEHVQHNSGGNMINGTGDEDESTLHPSTIEFDFDSFGPESIIFTPNNNKTTDVKVESRPTDATPENNSTKDSLILGVDKIHLEDQDKLAQADVIEQLQVSENENMPALNQEQSGIAMPRQIDEQDSEKNKYNDTIPIDHIVDSTRIDLKVIEPYKKVISHAGYCHHTDASAPAPRPGEAAPAIIVFSACYLPDRSRRDYNYVMDHLFLYVLSSLHELIADDYILIYLHNTQPNSPSTSVASNSTTNVNGSAGASSNMDEISRATTPQNNLPTFSWMKRCYQMIDRKLRKNLKILYLVKPTFWLKTIVIMCKPFISSKFSKKLRFIEDINGLGACLPLDQLILPASAESI